MGVAVTGLTPRQAEIALLAVRDMSVAQIAAQLCVSPHTVRNTLAAVYLRLGVQSRRCLLILALVRGWIDVAELSCEIEAAAQRAAAANRSL
jgi:DNA-binding CsgD family transcriptional regulator